MAATTDTAASPAPEVPGGFLEETATLLHDGSAEEIADAVVTVCVRRGILTPELDEEPADALRAEQLGEVFSLLDTVTAAVTAGGLAPAPVVIDSALDPALAGLWDDFIADAADPEVAAAVDKMLETGEVPAGAGV